MSAALRVADVIRFRGEAYHRGKRLPPHVVKALRHILDCRTKALGGHIHECDRCGNRCRVPLLILARMMGHSSPHTTMRYVEIEDHELRAHYLDVGDTQIVHFFRKVDVGDTQIVHFFRKGPALASSSVVWGARHPPRIRSWSHAQSTDQG